MARPANLDLRLHDDQLGAHAIGRVPAALLAREHQHIAELQRGGVAVDGEAQLRYDGGQQLQLAEQRTGAVGARGGRPLVGQCGRQQRQRVARVAAGILGISVVDISSLTICEL